MDQAQAWEKMRRLLKHMFRQHEGGEFVPDARERLREELAEAEVNPIMIEAFEKDLYSDAWHGEEEYKPLSYTEKYFIAHRLLYCMFGKEEFRERAFRQEAEGAQYLSPEDIQALLEDIWPNWRPK